MYKRKPWCTRKNCCFGYLTYCVFNVVVAVAVAVVYFAQLTKTNFVDLKKVTTKAINVTVSVLGRGPLSALLRSNFIISLLSSNCMTWNSEKVWSQSFFSATFSSASRSLTCSLWRLYLLSCDHLRQVRHIFRQTLSERSCRVERELGPQRSQFAFGSEAAQTSRTIGSCAANNRGYTPTIIRISFIWKAIMWENKELIWFGVTLF